MNGAFLLIFACIWSGMVCLFDGIIGNGLWHQIEARNYSATTGQITYSETTRHRGSKGRVTYGVDIRYHYMANGWSFNGTRYRYSTFNSSDSSWAFKVVAEHPVGSQTEVFYNPRNPGESLLSPGVNGSDLMLVLFIMPFNMVMLGLWTWLGEWLRARYFRPIAGGVKIITEGPRTSIRLPRYGALILGMAVVGGLSFVSIFILGFTTGPQPSLEAAAVVLCCVVAAGVGMYFWQWRKIHSGEDDLILDEASGTVGLPETFGRKERVMVGISEISDLTVEVITHQSSKGRISHTYAPTLALRSPNATTQKLADWSDRMKAQAFTDWLRQKLGLTNAPAQREMDVH